MKLVRKFGFIVHEPVMWAHYSNVWKQLGRENFTIILTDRFHPDAATYKESNARAFIDRISSLDYPFAFARDLISDKTKYEYIISNHIIESAAADTSTHALKLKSLVTKSAAAIRALASPILSSESKSRAPRNAFKHCLPLQLGNKQIRFMYGADIGEGWSLAPWNGIYDLFLCHGPNDQEQLGKRFKGKTALMGYPRYDDYFKPELEVESVLAEFNIDPEKQTILWMPTYGEGACSIPHYAEALASWRDHYNLIVRPHPISFTETPDDIRMLEELGYQIDRDPLRDMNKLYKISDVVLCDYGGSPFGVLYLGKRMLLLEVPDSKKWYTVEGSSNLELVAHYPVLTVETVPELQAIVADKAYWDSKKESTIRLRDKYFAEFRGNSSEKVAEILTHIERYL